MGVGDHRGAHVGKSAHDKAGADGEAIEVCRQPAQSVKRRVRLEGLSVVREGNEGGFVELREDMGVGGGFGVPAVIFVGPAPAVGERARRGVAAVEGHDVGRLELIAAAGVAVAAASGLLFTLGALHVYLLLISTRRRARDMAREMNAALQRTQSRNQVVMNAAPDAIVMTDDQGVVQWCNQASTSIFGRPAEALIGCRLAEVLPVLGEVQLNDWFERHGFSNRVIGYETAGVRNEGTSFPVAVSASRAELDGEWIITFIVRDTTDAKWAEQELLLRDRAIASSADGVVIVSMTLPNQPIIYANQAFEHITGYESHEVLGTNCRFLQGSEADQPGVKVIREAVAA